jgi:hypothetical protein
MAFAKSLTMMKNSFFFGKGAGFDALSDDEKKLARQLTDENLGEMIPQIFQPSVAMIDYLYTNFADKIPRYEARGLMAKTINNYARSPEAFEALIRHEPSYAYYEFDDLFRIAAASHLQPVWHKLDALYQKLHPHTYNAELANIACQYGFDDIAKELLTQANRSQYSIFYNVLKTLHTADSTRFKTFLAYAGNFEKNQTSLDDVFLAAASSNNVENAKLLLAQGADVNAKEGYALYYAAKNNNTDFFSFLMAQNVDFEKHGKRILQMITQSSSYNNAALQPLRDTVAAMLAKEAAIQADRERYALPRPDILSDTLTLPSGMKLTTLFNFETRQQIIITENKTTLSTMVTDFGDIKTPEVIESALQKLRDRGGSAEYDWMRKGGAKKTTLDKD